MKKQVILLTLAFFGHTAFGMYPKLDSQPIPTIHEISQQQQLVQQIFDNRRSNLESLTETTNTLEEMITNFETTVNIATLSEQDQIVIARGKSLIEHIVKVTNKEAEDYITKTVKKESKKEYDNKQLERNKPPKKASNRFFTPGKVLTVLGLGAIAATSYFYPDKMKSLCKRILAIRF